MTRTAQPRDGRMTLVEHLAELRRRIIISITAVTVGAVVVFVVFDPILDFLTGPYHDLTVGKQFPDGRDLIFTDPLEGFLVRIKVASYGGIAIAMPVVLWQIWRFVTPGLHPSEKKYAIPFILTSILLFASGAAVAWFTFPRALDFLLGVGGSSLEPFLTANKYLSLITLMMLAFGASFEFPVLLTFLLLARVVNTDQLKRGRRWAAVGLTSFAAVITPSQDPYSLLFMAGPLYLFYEITIVIGKVMRR